MKRRADIILQMVQDNEKENERFMDDSPQKTYHELQRVPTLSEINVTNRHSDRSISVIEDTPERELKKTLKVLESPTTISNMQAHSFTINNEPSTSFQSKAVPNEWVISRSTSSCSTSSSSSSSSSSSNSSNAQQNSDYSASRIQNRSKYQMSSTNVDESDIDLSDDDPTYINHNRQNTYISSSTSSSPLHQINENVTNERKSRKRLRNPSNWKQNKIKLLRNSGQPYVSLSKTKKNVAARKMKDVCKCRLKCFNKIQDAERKVIFDNYWKLSNIDLQRAYIRSCMFEIKPKYKYSNAARPRHANNAFYFTIKSIQIRVCKTYFINTLDITDRQLRTVKKKTNSQGFVERDNRGKHTNRKVIDPELLEDIKKHIISIPKIESHYLRAQTSKEYISEGKTVTDLWMDFNLQQKERNRLECEYWLYLKTFNADFNIGFYQPKKDRCDTCLAYELAPTDIKLELKTNHDKHLAEKSKCREEKLSDRENVDETKVCAVYDLQSVMLCPSPSYFYYCSKINCLNFTITELNKKNSKKNNAAAYGNVYCYFWDETQAQRGVNEIGSCVYDYLRQINYENPNKKMHITFYSDNCAGQQKNKSMAAIYSYSVNTLENIESITHKYFIKGHTQNEADNVHSLIEKEIKKNEKSGPIYIPYQYATLIKSARKSGKSFIVKELDYTFFYNIKGLQEQWGYNFNENTNKMMLLWSDIKVLSFKKGNDFTFGYKISYFDEEFSVVDMRNKRKKMRSKDEIKLENLYTEPFNLKPSKIRDLKDLVRKNLIPAYYTSYFNNLQ